MATGLSEIPSDVVISYLNTHLSSGAGRCGVDYGAGINPRHCLVANIVNFRWPNQDVPQTFYLNRGQDTMFDLPYSRTYQTCTITIDYTAPVAAPETIDIAPSAIKDLYAQVYRRCPKGPVPGIGGYVSETLRSFAMWLVSHSLWPELGPAPVTAIPTAEPGFLTATITKAETPKKRPGETEAAIAHGLAWFISYFGLTAPLDSASKTYLGKYVRLLTQHAESLEGGQGTGTWYDTAELPPDNMNYQCDATLGSPSVTDCEKLVYQGLGKTDTVEIGPGKTKILVEGECAIGVAAVTPITLTWAQITTAFTTLVEKCIESPLGSYGGRAFAGVVTDSFWIPSGMKKRDDTITGLNALPNGVNVTTWKHTGETANVVCEFRAANNQKPVKECQ